MRARSFNLDGTALWMRRTADLTRPTGFAHLYSTPIVHRLRKGGLMVAKTLSVAPG